MNASLPATLARSMVSMAPPASEVHQIVKAQICVIVYSVPSLLKPPSDPQPLERAMKVRINFSVGDCEDSLVLSGSLEEITKQADEELAKRGGTDAWSEVIEED